MLPEKPYERGVKYVEDGEFAGWGYWPSDKYEVHSGPFYFRKDEHGVVTTAFRPEEKNMNGGGALHGGAFMTFADFSLFAFAWDELAGGQGVTISLNGEFIGAAFVGDRVEGRGGVVRATKSLIFLQGQLFNAEKPIFNFSAIIKRVGPKPAQS